MPETRDVVVVGGGHNGLVTAFYLAKAGYKPLVLERREQPGGAAVTGEFHPGFKCSTLAHAAGPLRPDIVHDMQLERHGLKMMQPEMRIFAPSPDGRALLLYGDAERSAESIAQFSTKDAAKYSEFQQALSKIAKVFGRLLAMAPPSIDHPGAADGWEMLKAGKNIRDLGKKDM